MFAVIKEFTDEEMLGHCENVEIIEDSKDHQSRIIRLINTDEPFYYDSIAILERNYANESMERLCVWHTDVNVHLTTPIVSLIYIYCMHLW